MWSQLTDQLSAGSASVLLALLEAPEGKRRVSELERLRKGVFRTSSKGMLTALDRLSDLIAVGGQSLDVSMVPQRRVIGLATYGLSSKAPALRRLEPADDRQQRRLTHARRAGQRDIVARLDRQRHAVEDTHWPGPGGVLVHKRIDPGAGAARRRWHGDHAMLVRPSPRRVIGRRDHRRGTHHSVGRRGRSTTGVGPPCGSRGAATWMYQRSRSAGKPK